MLDCCVICKEFIFSWEKGHKCKPLWLCAILDEKDMPDSDKDFCYDVYAIDAEEAAEKCADGEEPSWDYIFVKNGGVDIDVKNSETGEIINFYVSAETTIEYRASAIKKEK